MAPLKPPIEQSEDFSISAAQATESHHEFRPDSSIAELCWINRAMLWRITWRSFIISLILVFVWPKTWVSDARLMPPEENSTSRGLGAILTSKAGDSLPAGLGDLLQSKPEGAVFIGVLRSDTVEDRLIDSFDLRRVYRVSTYQQAREILQDRTQIVEDRKSGIITVSVADHNAARARDLCAAYVDQLNRLVAELSTSSARRERIFLEGRLKEVKVELENDEKRLSQFSSKHTTFDLSIQGKAMLESAATLQGELVAAQSELQGLSAIYTDNNPRVRSVRARVEELQHQLQKLGGADASGTSSADAGGTQRSTSAESQSVYPTIRQLPVLGVTYSDLYREVKVQETVYEVLTKQYELARVQEAKEIPTVRTLDAPLVPERKSSPKRAQWVFAITVLAFLTGVAWISLKRAWYRSSPTSPRRLLLEEIGITIRHAFLQLQFLGRKRGKFWSRSELP